MKKDSGHQPQFLPGTWYLVQKSLLNTWYRSKLPTVPGTRYYSTSGTVPRTRVLRILCQKESRSFALVLVFRSTTTGTTLATTTSSIRYRYLHY